MTDWSLGHQGMWKKCTDCHSIDCFLAVGAEENCFCSLMPAAWEVKSLEKPTCRLCTGHILLVITERNGSYVHRGVKDIFLLFNFVILMPYP
jgi:hypothetical protein